MKSRSLLILVNITAMQKIIIEERFCGPPDSGNGGYVCGLIAKFAGFPAEIFLRKPPPLSKSLTLKKNGVGITLTDGDILIAEAKPADVSPKAPPFISFAEAVAASKNYIGLHDHVFPTCFVCGPSRGDDALRIFAGKAEGKNFVAAPWIPHETLAENGFVKDEFHWAALDCPGYFSIEHAPQKSVLGKMAARIEKHVKPGEKCVVIGWSIANDGRKHLTGTALYKEDGAMSAIAQATWIDI